MNKAAFLKLVQNYQQLTAADLTALEQVIAAFPYCQTAHILLAKGSHDQGHMLTTQRLRRAALHAPNRSWLKQLIESKPAAQVEMSEINSVLAAKQVQNGNGAADNFEFDDLLEETLIDSPLTAETETAVNTNQTAEPVFTVLHFPVAPLEPEVTIETQAKNQLAQVAEITPTEDKNTETSSAEETAETDIETQTEVEKEQVINQQEPFIAPLPFQVDNTAENTGATLVTEPLPERPVSGMGFFELYTHNALGYRLGSSRYGEYLEYKTEFTPAVPFTFQPELLVEHSHSFQSEPVEDSSAKPAPSVLPQQDLINEFLKQASKSRIKATATPKASAQEDLSTKSTKLNKALVSENLAQIFAKQGKNKKAIKIYQQLQLKYPEKSDYFASQIIKLQNPFT